MERLQPREPPVRWAWPTLGILALTYMFSYLDRQILVLLVEPVRRDLRIDDTQFSLLTGLAFALFYAVAAFPLAILADRWSRKRLILIGVALWGVMTMACGLSRSFGELFVARMGVGLGEAALTPTAYALIADLFPKARQARAMGLFVLGTFAGSALSLVLGGMVIGQVAKAPDLLLPIGAVRPWQLVFLLIGGATLVLLVPLSRIVDPAPPRARRDAVAAPALGPWLWSQRARYFALFLGIPFSSLAVYGMQAWLPALFVRAHGWSATDAGVRLGLATLGPGLVGVVLGGWLADRWRAAGRQEAALLLNALVAAAMAPVPVLIAALPGADAALLASGLFFFLSSVIVPLAPTALQAVTPPAIRARTAALFLLVVNLVGIGLGPTAVAAASDHLLPWRGALGPALALVGGLGFALSAALLFLGLPGYRRALAADEV